MYMADGTTKAIETVQIGEAVLDAYGFTNVVSSTESGLKNDQVLVKINNDHVTTNAQLHLGSDRFFYVVDIAAIRPSGTVVYVQGPEGPYARVYDGLDASHCRKLEPLVDLQNLMAPRNVSSVETVQDAGPETVLYDLLTTGSHTYIVNSYAVVGWPTHADFDYTLWVKKC